MLGFLGFPILKALFVSCSKKVRTVSVTFSLNARPFQYIWSNLKQKIISTKPADRCSNFRLYQQFRPTAEGRLIGRGPSLLFDDRTVTLIYRFLCVAVGKVYRLRLWLNDNATFYETFICLFISEAKPLCFSLCSQMFDDVERC